MHNVSIVNAGYKQTNISGGNQLFPIKINKDPMFFIYYSYYY